MRLPQPTAAFVVLTTFCLLQLSHQLASALHCCYFDPEKQMANLECYIEKESLEWCFVCEYGDCWLLNINYKPNAANGVSFISSQTNSRQPTDLPIQPGCHDYHHEIGTYLLITGRFCFCRNDSYCNQRYWKQRHHRQPGTSNGNGTKTAARPTQTTLKSKTETLILFILIGIMVLFVAFCCIVLNQTCCVLGLCSN